MKETTKGRLFTLLFALPFAGVGIGFLVFGVIPNLYEWHQMKNWPQVEARLLDAGLSTNRGSKSDTYQAIARYSYRYQAQNYTSERVAIMGGSDNIGDFQQGLARHLELAHRMGQPVPAWVNPNDPGDAVLNRDLRWNLLGFKMIFVLVFGGVGIGLMVFTLKAKVGATYHPESTSKPWLAQQEWASPEVTCDSKSSLWLIWFIATVWNLTSLPATLAAPEEWADGNKLILIALIFPLAGIYLLVWAIKYTLSWRRFGLLRLMLDPYPGSLGGQVGGTIEIPIAYNPKQRFPVNLQCVRRYVTGSGKNRTSHESIIWQSNGLAHSQPSATGGTRLALGFNVPANLPASETYSDDYRFWRLELNADLPGVDLHRQFEIPVFATGEKSRTESPLSTNHPQLNEEREANIEAVANIQQIPGGVRMHYPMLHRAAGNNLVGLVCGLFFAGAGILMHFESDAPAFMVWIFTLVGVLIIYVCLKWLFTSLYVQLDHNGLISERYWLGMAIGRDQIPRADIKKLYIDISARGQSAEGYQEICKIIALTRDGKKILIAMNLKGRDTAQLALEAIGGLSGYGVN
jgi:hypothetical protein